MEPKPEDRFDAWWGDTHDGTGDFEYEGDVDECVSDLSFDDPESY